MAKNWWFKFDYKIWRTDSSLRRCSLETRGFWLECLCVMNEMDSCEVSGTLAELARLLGCESNEVMRCATELKQTKTADVTLGNGTVTLVSRRLKRELNVREQTRLRVQKSRSNADVTPQSKSKSKKEEPTEAVASTIWDEFTALQVRQGILPATARSRLGKLIKTYGQDAVIQTYAEVKDALADKANAYAYFQGAVKNFKVKNNAPIRDRSGVWTVNSDDDLQRLIQMNCEY